MQDAFEENAHKLKERVSLRDTYICQNIKIETRSSGRKNPISDGCSTLVNFYIWQSTHLHIYTFFWGPFKVFPQKGLCWIVECLFKYAFKLLSRIISEAIFSQIYLTFSSLIDSIRSRCWPHDHPHHHHHHHHHDYLDHFMIFMILTVFMMIMMLRRRRSMMISIMMVIIQCHWRICLPPSPILS